MNNLTDAEWNIMNLLWATPALTMTQLTQALFPSTNWSKHTVMTYLKRMEVKGFIRFEEGVKAKQYYPILLKEDAILTEKNLLLQKAFKGNSGLMFSTLLEHDTLTESEIDQLMQLLESKKS
ncbi:MAG: BlaI/MecI/CopY family transcriptional regulator [Lachnospiraceae bacterium]